jgi:hypothetical protein
MVALKALVAAMGILIVLGIGVLGYGMYQKAQNPDFTFFEPDPVAPLTPAAMPSAVSPVPGLPASVVAREPLRPFGDIALPLPKGCDIVEMTPHRRFLYLRIGPGRACARVIVVDLRGGRVLGTLSVEP